MVWDAVYHVGKSILLVGQHLRGVSPSHWGESVVIVFMGHAITAWKVGEQWKSWCSRIIKATLGGGRRKTNHLHIFSCYAPTFATTRAEKDNFLDHVQQALDEIPSNKTYVILGHFNARVGSRDPMEEDHWKRAEVLMD